MGTLLFIILAIGGGVILRALYKRSVERNEWRKAIERQRDIIIEQIKNEGLE